ncbi:MAG: sulfur carrier protein ThiS [Flavobacteriales bacterium]|nr:sulfur carrier protein ThiS [Flavobacteriales bacterium]
MEIIVNNEAVSVNAGENISGLLRQLSVPIRTGIALAVNEDVIPAPQWDHTILEDHDRVIIIKAAQGG